MKKYKIPHKNDSYFKVIEVIDSCETREHLKGAERLIDIFKRMYPAQLIEVDDCDNYLKDRYEDLGIDINP